MMVSKKHHEFSVGWRTIQFNIQPSFLFSIKEEEKRRICIFSPFVHPEIHAYCKGGREIFLLERSITVVAIVIRFPVIVK